MNTEIYANPNQSYMLGDNNKTEHDKEIVVVTHNSVFFTITHLIISLFALYLSWRCNNGFNILSFLAAFCCPYFYIIYAIAVHGGCNVFDNIQPINKIN
jgi:hypothetical protein